MQEIELRLVVLSSVCMWASRSQLTQLRAGSVVVPPLLVTVAVNRPLPVEQPRSLYSPFSWTHGCEDPPHSFVPGAPARAHSVTPNWPKPTGMVTPS